VAVSLGLLESAPIEFGAAQDVTGGGVLLAAPTLLAMGLLAQREFYALPRGYYGLESVFLLLALTALARLPSLEQLRYQAPGEWGQLLGLDRIPEVRTRREKLKILCREAGRAARWNTALAQQWITAEQAAEPVFYADGHVRKLAEGGRQISLVSTHPGGEGRRLAALLFARWSQENYFRYLRQHYGLDALVEHGTEPMPDTAFTVNPAWRKLPAEVRQKHAHLRQRQALLEAANLEQPISEPAVTEYQLRQGQLHERIEHLQRELEALKPQRKAVPHHVLGKDLPEEFRFTRLRSERKHFGTRSR